MRVYASGGTKRGSRAQGSSLSAFRAHGSSRASFVKRFITCQMAFWAHCRSRLGNGALEADTGVAFVFCGRTLEPLRVGWPELAHIALSGSTRASGLCRHLSAVWQEVGWGPYTQGHRKTRPSGDSARAWWSGLPSTTVIKATGESNSGKKGCFYLANASGPSLRDRAGRNAAHWTAPPGLLGLLSYTTQAHLPEGGTAPVD